MIAGKGSAEYNWICPAYRSLAGFEVSLVGRFSSVPRGTGFGDVGEQRSALANAGG